MSTRPIYKICPRVLWERAVAAGRFTGSPVDVQDGFIHFSTAEQVRETAERHFRGESNLVLVVIEPSRLDAQLAWEPSRGGKLFPHLYGPLPVSAALAVHSLMLRSDGVPDIREDML